MTDEQPSSSPETPEEQPPVSPETPEAPPRAGVEIESGRDVNVAGDVAGRDIIKTTVGFGPREVQRLVITVGVIVFVTAACFFSGGVVVGGVAINALNRPVASDDPAAAARFASKLGELNALAAGQPFSLEFTEQEISAYFRQVIAPRIGVMDGKVRLLDEPGRLVVGGRLDQLGGAPFAATFETQNVPGEPLRLTGAAVQVVRLGTSSFGWVMVPTSVLRPVADGVNSQFGSVELETVKDIPSFEDTPAWAVTGVTR